MSLETQIRWVRRLFESAGYDKRKITSNKIPQSDFSDVNDELYGFKLKMSERIG